MTEGREDFLAQFVQAERSLRALLLASTGDLNVVDDLMQNVAATLWAKWDQYDPARPFRSWAMGMARIEVLRWRRAVARDRLVLSEDAINQLADAADRLADDADERRQVLGECLAQLGDTARQVLAMKYAHGLRAAQIAERLGKKVGAIEMTLTRTRRALRDCIERKLANVEQA